MTPSPIPTAFPTSTPTSFPTRDPTSTPTRRHLVHEWSLDESYDHKVKYEDDVIFFNWTALYHKVNVVTDYNGTYTCQGGEEHTGVTDVLGYESFNYTFPANGTYYFYCPISNHCENGMQKTVTVLPRELRGQAYETSSAGYYNDPYQQMEKEPCSLGTYQDEEGKTSCKMSRTCEKGFRIQNFEVSDKVMATEDRVCKLCAVDRYSTEENSRGCTKCGGGVRSDETRTRCLGGENDDMDPAILYSIIGISAAMVIFGSVFFIYRRKTEKIEVSYNIDTLIY